MTTFADSSALVKLYADEADAELVRAIALFVVAAVARIEVPAAILDEAASMVVTHGLRAYDGVQLACAVAARTADPEVDTLLCFDADLSTAAAREGFSLAG